MYYAQIKGDYTLSFHPWVAPGVSAIVAPILCVSSPSQSACNYPTEMPNQEKGNLIKSELKDFKDLRDRQKYKLIAGAVLFYDSLICTCSLDLIFFVKEVFERAQNNQSAFFAGRKGIKWILFLLWWFLSLFLLPVRLWICRWECL